MPDQSTAPASLSPTEAGAQLGVCAQSIYRLIARGELAATKRGGHWQIAPATVERAAGARVAR